MVKAHSQKVTNTYTVAYPDHTPREGDPHYKDFNAYRREHVASARCQFAIDCGDSSLCSGGLELHHQFIEFAVENEVDFSLLEYRFPGISDPNQVGAWVESAENFLWLCAKHHRGHGGIHHASAADWQAEHFVRNLIS